MSASAVIFGMALLALISGTDGKNMNMTGFINLAKSVTVENCGTSQDALKVENMQFDPLTLSVVVRGKLSREITGGSMIGKLHLGSIAPHSSISQHLKHVATKFSPSYFHRRKLVKELCAHLKHGAARNGSKVECPFVVGTQEFRFALDTLPQQLPAGELTLQAHAQDQAGQPVTCFKVQFMLSHSAKDELVRFLQVPQCHWGCYDHMEGYCVEQVDYDSCNYDKLQRQVEWAERCHCEVMAVSASQSFVLTIATIFGIVASVYANTRAVHA